MTPSLNDEAPRVQKIFKNSRIRKSLSHQISHSSTSSGCSSSSSTKSCTVNKTHVPCSQDLRLLLQNMQSLNNSDRLVSANIFSSSSHSILSSNSLADTKSKSISNYQTSTAIANSTGNTYSTPLNEAKVVDNVEITNNLDSNCYISTNVSLTQIKYLNKHLSCLVEVQCINLFM